MAATFTGIGTLPQSKRRDFSDVSCDEAMRRARDCVPELRERAQASEDARVLLREAVETLWSFYGANAIYTRDPLQRYLRDVQAINQHFSFNFDIAGAAFGIAALGGQYAHPTL